MKEELGVLFVCMGNICRSPTAEAVLRACVSEAGLSERITVDSAGTHAYHTGEPPDARAQEVAWARGVDLSGLRARAVIAEDFERFDYVLAMDRSNLRWLQAMADGPARVELFLAYAPAGYDDEIADPYYGGSYGFDLVLDQVEAASRGLITTLVRRHRLDQ